MGQPLLVIAIGLMVLSLSSGCIMGGDAKGVANGLQTIRSTYVTAGLLAPATVSDRLAYSNELLSFRKRIQEAGGTQKGTLNDYVDGSLSLIAMQETVEKGNEELENAASTLFDCSMNGFAGKALLFFKTAREKSEMAHKSFQRVLENAEIANELGVDYLQNAVTTTQGTTPAYAQRAEDIKISCGNTS